MIHQRYRNLEKEWFGSDSNKRFKAGSTTEVMNVSAPPAQTTSQSIADWVSALPSVYETEMKYAPQIAAQEKSINDNLYPTTAGLQESLAGIANQGINATTMPDWMKKNYQSDLNANLGTNAGSPAGADYVSTGMQKQLFEQQKYYQNLGLSLAGRQPLTTASTNWTSGMTPQSVMQSDNTNYGNYAAASRPLSRTKVSNGTLWGMF